METNSNSRNTATGAIALHALATHIVDQRLPAPSTVTLPHLGHPDLEVWVWDRDVSTWLASGFVVDDEQSSPMDAAGLAVGAWESVRLDGRVTTPLGAVKIQLRFVAQVVRSLASVPA